MRKSSRKKLGLALSVVMVMMLILPSFAFAANVTVTSVVCPLIGRAVTVGTTLDGARAALPATVKINLSDSSAMYVPVTWDADSTPAYSATTIGDYYFDGALTLPANVTNPTNVVAKGKISVANSANITGLIPPIIGRPVALNTPIADAKALLPPSVKVTLSNGTMVYRAVTWSADSTPSYNSAVSGTYSFSGTISTKPTVLNPSNIKAVGNIIVVGGLTITGAEPINKSTIKVVFNQAVDAVAPANFAVTVGGVAKTVQSATLNAAKTEATVVIQGLNYGDLLTVVVSGVTAGGGVKTIGPNSTDVQMKTINELYALELTADKTVLTADGADNTVIHAKLYEKANPTVPVDVDATLTMSTTLGALSYTSVAMNNGEAAVVLTSIASATTVTAYVNATVAAVASGQDGAFVGIAATTLPITFDPAGSGANVDMVTLVSAEASQGDRIIAKFSGKITKDDIVAQFPGATPAAQLAAAQAANFGFQVDANVGVGTLIKDIVSVNDTTLMLILNVDTFYDSLPVPNSTDRLDTKGAAITVLNAADAGAYMRDNVTHNLSVPTNIGTKVMADAVGKDFIFTDPLQPYIAGVDVENQMVLRVQFYEPMAEDLCEQTTALAAAPTAGTELNDHFRVDGKPVMIVPAAATAADMAYANLNNYIVATELYVGKDDTAAHDAYLAATGTDTRNWVTIRLDKLSKLAAGTYTLQANNVGDWAAMTDPNNMVATQTFDFTVQADTSKPVVTIIKQSPEQWLLNFSQDVTTVGINTIADAIKIYKADEYSLSPPVAMTQGTDYQIIPVDGVNTVLTAPLAPAATIAAPTDAFLIEFLTDWTVYYNTSVSGENYFTSTHNPYLVAVDKFENSAGNSMSPTVLSVNNPIDVVSPTISSVQDVNDLTGKSVNGCPAVTDAGQMVYVRMSEPVQIPYTELDGLPGFTAGDMQNTDPETSSQQQTAGTGIPQPTFEFVKGDITWQGRLVDTTVPLTTVSDDDYSFVVQPINLAGIPTTLEAGTWTLIIRSISDDVGNTSATQTFNFTIAGTVTSTSTRIAWVGYDDNFTVGGKDYVYIKFTKPMKSTGVTGVASTTVYQFNAAPLPAGSSVTKGIPGVTADWDGVTIAVPPGTWGVGVGPNDTWTLNVLNSLTAADGEALSGPHEVEVTDTTLVVAADADMLFEAAYIPAGDTRYSVQTAAGVRAIITGMVAYDVIDATGAAVQDGRIDGALLRLSRPDGGALDAAVTFNYGGSTTTAGVTTDNATANDSAGANIFYPGIDARLQQIGEAPGSLVAGSALDKYVFIGFGVGTQIMGTATDNLTMKASDGAFLVNAGRVLDAALPVITKADATAGSTTVTLTFSEAVWGGTAPVPAALVAADFAYTDTVVGGSNAIASVAANTNYVTSLQVTTNAAVVVAEIGDGVAPITGDAINAVAANVFDKVGNGAQALVKEF